MIRSQLVALLLARRDNDVTVNVAGLPVPITGVRYDPAADTIVIELEPEEHAIALAIGPNPPVEIIE
nr:hypothetical protein [Micromonospora sp. DSM 115978]